MVALGLTKRQRDCLSFISEYTKSKGFSPSYDEIRDALGVASKSNIHRLIYNLLERGYLGIRPGCSRSLVVLVEPAQPQTPLVRAWNAATPAERQDLLFLIGARIESEAA